MPPDAQVRHGQRPAPSRLSRKKRRGIPIAAYLYMMAEILRIFILAVFTIAFVYITVIAFQLVRDGIRIDFVWPHVLRTISYPLFFSIPLAFLFGITLGIGRMANDRELSALRAQGVSHAQLWTPILVLGIALGGLTFYISGWMLPEVHYEQANLRQAILDQLDHLGSGSNRTILLPGDVSLWVKRYDGPHLRGIVLDIHKGNRSQIIPEIGSIAGEAIRDRLAAGQLAGKVTLIAQEADLEVSPDRSRIILSLRGVGIQVPEIVAGPRGVDVFHQMYTIEKLPLPLSFSRRGESAKDLSNPDLLRWIAALKKQARSVEEALRASAIARPGASALSSDGPASAVQTVEALGSQLSSIRRKAARGESELHGRFTFSLACLAFPLVAFPIIVLLERQGRLTHFFVGNLLVITIFFPLVMAGHLAADRGWPAALSMGLPNLALLVVGIPLARAMHSR